MKKWFTGLLFLSLTNWSIAQNDAVMAAPLGTIQAPLTGCALTSTETVTIRIFNAGPGPINAPFDVSYLISGPINSSATETVMVGTILQNSTMTYTFTTTADLSAIGSYVMDATVTVAGDPNNTNDTYSAFNIVNNAASDGGTATGGTNVCITSNSGNVTLVGNVGNVLNWEYSVDMGSTWINISNITTSQSYNNLVVETWYRANVQNASCATATSTIAVMTIDNPSVGGTTAGGPTSVCTGTNAGTVTVGGITGTVDHWEFSTNGGASWTPIANTTTSQAYLNLVTTTIYRAFIVNGSCPGAYSNNRTITVAPNSVGGTVTSDATVCSGSNSGTLTLAGHVGAVQRWQFSTNGGMTWNNIANTTTTQNYTNLVATRMYRAQVRSGACTQANSIPATITVVANSVGGTVTSNATVCSGANQDTLTVAGYSGTVLNWESSENGGVTWSPIANTDDTLIYLNLDTTTRFRAVVQAGTCPTGNSTSAIITVNEASVGGNLSGNNTVCGFANSGNITLSGQTGTPTQWESSTDGGFSWTPIANTTTTESYLNLSVTTLYRSSVQNGICPADYSDTVTITVDSVTVGGTVNANTTVCAGNNSGTLVLTGETGDVLNWENSTDGGFTWVPIANVTNSQAYNNVNVNTHYRAIVQSGICPSAISSFAILTTDQAAIGGTLYGGTTVCEGINSGALTLVGFNSSIANWESSIDGGFTWSPIANTTAFENFSNLNQTTDYRVITSSGVCPNDTSTIATVAVDAATIGGTVTIDSTVCAGANGDTLVLSGQTGTVLNWEMSNDGGVTWITLANDTTIQAYNNLMTTTSYRAKIKNGVCSAIGSAPATITVNPQSDGGTLNSSATVCEGSNFGILTLSSTVGTVLDWEMSTDSGATWTSLATTGVNYSYSNITDTTWFHVLVQSGTCAPDTSTIAFINLYPAPISAFTADTLACVDEVLSFTNTTSNSAGFVTLSSWDFGDGNTSTSVNPTHTYTSGGVFNVVLFSMNNFGCADTTSQNITVNLLPATTIFPLGPTSFCEGDSVVLAAAFNVSYDYAWNTGDTTFQIVADSTMDYIVTVTDLVTGCVDTDSEFVTVFALPVADAGTDTSIALGMSTVLMGSGGPDYLWSPPLTLDNPFIANPTATPTATTVYILTITDINGCTDADSVTVSINGDIILNIRNIITPNGDGYNDTWYIENILNFPDNVVNVYNRYGQKVYEAEAYNNLWDGTYNGTPLPDGTYYYVVELTESETVFKGAVNIIRSQNK